MARKIDETKPLSKADRAWLETWSKFDVIARIDNECGVEDAGDDEPDADTTRIDLIAVLAKHGINPGDDPVAAIDAALDAKAQAEKPVVGPFDDEIDESESDEDGDGSKPYEDWTNDELRRELANRELSKSGSKAELIARLAEDDDA